MPSPAVTKQLERLEAELAQRGDWVTLPAPVKLDLLARIHAVFESCAKEDASDPSGAAIQE